ncbi:MAG: SH3 domain-containing protein [Anaerolineae bacterium]|nr:SH3 domain-containing protein [Candidatus Roseilinea sp.]MDW8449459.1 SH3 domain-containing protein [Anaerolineae bacterium]
MKARTLISAPAVVLAVLVIALGSAPPALAAPAHVRGTPVTRVMALVNLNIRSGPGLRYHVVGMLRPGHRATVTGLSDDYNWWRIRCPRGGVCWVSANPNYSKPVAWR